MNRVLNATVQRTADHAAPEITLDPLEIVGGMHYFHISDHLYITRVCTQVFCFVLFCFFNYCYS